MKNTIKKFVPQNVKNNKAVRSLYGKIVKAKLATETEKLEDFIKQKSFKNLENGIFAICHPEYRGIKSATYKNFDNIIEIKEFHSKTLARKIAKEVVSLNPKTVVLNGYPFGYDLLAEEIYHLNKDITILTFCHGPFIWFDFYPAENVVFTNYLRLNKEGVIRKLGFCKNDLVEYFSKKGYHTAFVMNRFDLDNNKTHKLNKDKVKIGVFGSNMWHRNLLNQVLGGLMIEGSEIHVNEINKHDFIDNNRVVQHGMMPHEKYLEVFQEMDIALYVSFTDSFPMTLIESMSYGIPAVASNTSDVYSFNSKLKEKLIVSGIDSPVAISEKITYILNNYDEIQKEILAYSKLLHEKVEKSLEDFIKG